MPPRRKPSQDGRTTEQPQPQAQTTQIVTQAEVVTPSKYHDSRLDYAPMVLEEQWNCLVRVSTALMTNGAFPDTVKTPQQGALLLLISYELGIPYTVGMRCIDVIYNRPALRGQLIGGLLRAKGCKIDWLESTEDRATVQITRPDGSVMKNTVTLQEVAKLRTSEGYGTEKKNISLVEKANWKQQPKVMLQRFTLKQTANVFCEDMILGLKSDDEVDLEDRPATIDVTPARPAALPPAAPVQAPPAAAPAPSLAQAFAERTAPPAAAKTMPKDSLV